MALPLSRDAVPFCPARARLDNLGTAIDSLEAKLAAAESDERAAVLETAIAELRVEAGKLEADLAETPPAVYRIRPASRRQRIEFERTLAVEGVRAVALETVRAAMREGVRAIAAEDSVASVLALLEAVWVASDAGEILSPEVLGAYQEAEQTLRHQWAPYRVALADEQHWRSLAPRLAAQWFLEGIEGSPPLPRRGSLVADEVLEAALPEEDLLACGWQAFRLAYADRADAKKSASGSSSPASPTPSAETSTPPSPPADGKSSATSTSATPPS